MILVDTSVWVDVLRAVNSPERHALHRLLEDDADLGVTGIVITEVLQGIQQDRDFHAIKDRLMAFPVFGPSGVDTYVQAARMYRQCRKRGKSVRKTVDCIIAAICLENDLLLFHKDRDFDLIAACTALRCHALS